MSEGASRYIYYLLDPNNKAQLHEPPRVRESQPQHQKSATGYIYQTTARYKLEKQQQKLQLLVHLSFILTFLLTSALLQHTTNTTTPTLRLLLRSSFSAVLLRLFAN